VQFWVIQHFCEPVFERWLRQTLDAGVTTLPAAKYFKFNASQWVPRGWQWVDPRNEAEAQIVAINNGLMTRTQALAERGLDIEDVLRERQGEDEMLAEFGIVLPGGTNPNVPAQPVPPGGE
jgi:capsid protein